jgi:hypothetical protein
LDEPIKGLSRFRNSSYSDRNSEEVRAALNKVDPAINFLKRWQEYVIARKGANPERPRQILHDLTSNDNGDLVPRSQLLAELQKYPTEQETRSAGPRLEQIDEIVSKANSLDRVPEAIKELRAIQSRRPPSPGSDGLTGTLNALISIDRTYREFQAGLPTKLDGPAMGPQDLASAAVTPLKAQLLLLVLPRYLNAPPDLNPRPSETVQGYLQRVIDEARARTDGGLLSRARDAQKLLTGSYQTTNEPQGMALIAAAKNQEAAGQYAFAVASYQNALRNGADAVPAKWIGEKLTALKQAHPTEYEEGIRLFLAPPARPEFFGSFPRGPMGSEPMTNSLPVPGAAVVSKPSPTVSATPH